MHMRGAGVESGHSCPLPLTLSDEHATERIFRSNKSAFRHEPTRKTIRLIKDLMEVLAKTLA
jgi:hypothetical protein